MKIISLLTAVLLVSSYSFANSLKCTLNEFQKGEHTMTAVEILGSGTGHTGMQFFKSTLFPEVSGFISFMSRDNRLFAVVSVNAANLQTNSSSQYQLMADGQYIQHQYIIPDPDTNLAGVEVICTYFQ